MKRLILALSLLTACATVPVDRAPAFVRSAETCLQSAQECFVLQVDNRNYYSATLYVNGGRFDEAPSLSHSTFFIPDWRLKSDRCAKIMVRLAVDGSTLRTTKECLPPGGHYQLDINWSSPIAPLHVWLTPRPR